MAGVWFFVLSFFSVALLTIILVLVNPVIPDRLWTGLEIICFSIPIFGVVSIMAAGMSLVRFGAAFLTACIAFFLLAGGGVALRDALRRIFFRSFLIQAAWTFEGLQSIGFTYGIAPILKQVYPDSRERAEVMRKYLNFFNSHPYMSTAILGATAALERRRHQENIGTTEQLRDAVSGPLAALGDALFWTGLKPLFSSNRGYRRVPGIHGGAADFSGVVQHISYVDEGRRFHSGIASRFRPGTFHTCPETS